MIVPEVRQVGREGQPVVVVDDFAADPDALRAYAARQSFEPGRHAYPGVRAPLPDDYLRENDAAIRVAVEAILGRPGEPVVIDASFSIVSTPRASLGVGQRLPHCDAHDAGRIAFVHYLAPDEMGGTAFFRHRSTGFETVGARRADIYRGQLDAELRYGGVPDADYLGADSRLFEPIAHVDWRYNRALFYRSFLLHSGMIPPGAALSPDPRDGRLTVTGFLSA